MDRQTSGRTNRKIPGLLRQTAWLQWFLLLHLVSQMPLSGQPAALRHVTLSATLPSAPYVGGTNKANPKVEPEGQPQVLYCSKQCKYHADLGGIILRGKWKEKKKGKKTERRKNYE